MDVTTEAMRVGLDLTQLRAQIASFNIAGANVPGAVPHGADFSGVLGVLRQAAADPQSAAARLADITHGSLQERVHALPEASGDGASLDDQVAQLNIDSLQYRALAEGLSRRFAMLQLAISGR